MPALSTGNPGSRIGRVAARVNEPTDAVEEP
jgi:hypothetical protein